MFLLLDLVVTLIGGDDPVDGHGDDGFVAVTETEAERSESMGTVLFDSSLMSQKEPSPLTLFEAETVNRIPRIFEEGLSVKPDKEIISLI